MYRTCFLHQLTYNRRLRSVHHRTQIRCWKSPHARQLICCRHFQAKNAGRIVAKVICLPIVRIQHRAIPNRDASRMLPVIHHLNPSNNPNILSKDDAIFPNCPPVPVYQETKKGLHPAVYPLENTSQSRRLLHFVHSRSNLSDRCNALARFFAVQGQSRLALQNGAGIPVPQTAQSCLFSACLTQTGACSFAACQGQDPPAVAVQKCPCSRPAQAKESRPRR